MVGSCLTLMVAVLMTVLAALIVRWRIGQTLIAIRRNETLVGAIRIEAWKYKRFAFVAAAIYGGFRLCLVGGQRNRLP